MTIRVSDQRLLGALMDALREEGCIVAPVEKDRCRVASRHETDVRQAFLEVRFFVRAWAGNRGIKVLVEA